MISKGESIEEKHYTELEYVGSLGGEIRDCVIDSHYAYFMEGYNLHTFDITNPIKPKAVAITHFNDYLTSIVIIKNAIYVGKRYGGYDVIDITNHENPKLCKHVAGGRRTFVRKVKEKIFRISGIDRESFLIDTRNPLDPQDIYLSKEEKESLLAEGGQLRNINVSFKTFGNVSDVAISGKYAYLSTTPGGMKIINISNPKQPEFISELNILDESKRIFICEKKVYLLAFKKNT